MEQKSGTYRYTIKFKISVSFVSEGSEITLRTEDKATGGSIQIIQQN